MAMGQNPNRTPSEHPNPATKIGSKMGGDLPTEMGSTKTVLTTTAMSKDLELRVDAVPAPRLVRAQNFIPPPADETRYVELKGFGFEKQAVLSRTLLKMSESEIGRVEQVSPRNL